MVHLKCKLSSLISFSVMLLCIGFSNGLGQVRAFGVCDLILVTAVVRAPPLAW